MVGVIYDPLRLEGVYNSEASPQYQPVDGEYVLRNYLNGIHPRTNGYPILADEFIYDPKIDAESPNTTMQTYIEKYKDTFDQDVLWWLANRVIGR